MGQGHPTDPIKLSAVQVVSSRVGLKHKWISATCFINEKGFFCHEENSVQ